MSLTTYDEPRSTHVYLSTWPRKNWLRFVPFSWMTSARSTHSGRLTSNAPPSPHITFLVSWKLRQATSASAPRGCPR